jgi:hypothetical protein
METMKRAAILALLMFGAGIAASVVLGCSSSAPQTYEAAPAAPIVSKGRPIVGLRTRDRIVTIVSTGGKDLRFTVRDAGGQVLADAITDAELREKDPLLFELCRSAVAQGDGSYLDATLTLH